VDTISDQSYAHRRQWIEDKLYALVRVFVLDLCAYAVMSNHYLVVLPVDAVQAEAWSQEDVIDVQHPLVGAVNTANSTISAQAEHPAGRDGGL
jgi:hypothetical protein